MNTSTICERSAAAAEVLARLRSCLPARFRGVGPETPIASLELDSLDRVEFLCALGTEFNISLTISEFEAAKTQGQIAALIQHKSNISH